MRKLIAASHALKIPSPHTKVLANTSRFDPLTVLPTALLSLKKFQDSKAFRALAEASVESLREALAVAILRVEAKTGEVVRRLHCDGESAVGTLRGALAAVFGDYLIFPMGGRTKPMEPGAGRPTDDHTRTALNGR